MMNEKEIACCGTAAEGNGESACCGTVGEAKDGASCCGSEGEAKVESSCCGASGEAKSTSACCSAPAEKNLDIDFLYLDLNTCERCIGTGDTLDEAIQDVSNVLKASGYHVNLRKTNITSKELAEEFEFRSSPTIRINGKDIAMEVRETPCKDCGDICNGSVDCRVWEHNGNLYDQPPKELVVDAIMRTVYGSRDTLTISQGPYVLPENLRSFFEGAQKKETV